MVGAAVALGAHPLADGAAAAVPAAAGRRDRRGAALLRAVAVRRRPGDQRRAAPGARGALARTPACCRGRCCCPARGSAATATATRSSPPRRCAGPPRGRRRPRWTTTSTSWTALRTELSMSDRLVTPTDELYALAEDVAGRLPVPGRRALPPGAARHLRPAGRHVARACSAPSPELAPQAELPPTTLPTSCAPTSTSSTPRCAATAPARSPTTGCCGCARPSRCSASTCAGWTCGRTPASTRRSSASCWPGPGRATDYAGLDEAARVELLAARAARCAVRWSGRTPSCRRPPAASSTCCVAAAEQVALLGPRDDPELRDQHVRVGERRARGRRPAQGGRAARPRRRRRPDLLGRHLPAVRDDRRPAERRRRR